MNFFLHYFKILLDFVMYMDGNKKEVCRMAGNIDFDTPLDIELPYADAAELKANQSVRATFRLSENTILTLNIVSNGPYYCDPGMLRPN